MHTKEFSALNDFSQDVVDAAHERVMFAEGMAFIGSYFDADQSTCLIGGEAPAVTALLNRMRNAFSRRYLSQILAQCHKIDAARTAVAVAAETSHV